jgi:hypothetical protein
MSLYNIKFYKDGVLIFETNVNHNLTYKALLYAEGEFLNKGGTTYDEIKINEINKIDDPN